MIPIIDDFFISEHDYQIAEQNGISRKNAWQRVNLYGFDISEAITKPLKKEGIRFTTEEIEIMKAHDVTVDTARQRIRVLKWDRQKALTYPREKRRAKNG